MLIEDKIDNQSFIYCWIPYRTSYLLANSSKNQWTR